MAKTQRRRPELLAVQISSRCVSQCMILDHVHILVVLVIKRATHHVLVYFVSLCSNLGLLSDIGFLVFKEYDRFDVWVRIYGGPEGVSIPWVSGSGKS